MELIAGIFFFRSSLRIAVLLKYVLSTKEKKKSNLPKIVCAAFNNILSKPHLASVRELQTASLPVECVLSLFWFCLEFLLDKAAYLK